MKTSKTQEIFNEDTIESEENEKYNEQTVLITTRFNNHELFHYNRFSDLGKLVRVLAWGLKFVYNSRSSHSRINDKVLSAEGEIQFITMCPD